jgi:uncharacterized membrane protein YecN with MAPEG domain
MYLLGESMEIRFKFNHDGTTLPECLGLTEEQTKKLWQLVKLVRTKTEYISQQLELILHNKELNQIEKAIAIHILGFCHGADATFYEILKALQTLREY